jgi:hypothetical protein
MRRDRPFSVADIRYASRPGSFSKGGKTPMLGKGDRTMTATADSAGTQSPARTGQKSTDNRSAAKGGAPTHGRSVSMPAKPSRTAPAKAGRNFR